MFEGKWRRVPTEGGLVKVSWFQKKGSQGKGIKGRTSHSWAVVKQGLRVIDNKMMMMMMMMDDDGCVDEEMTGPLSLEVP